MKRITYISRLKIKLNSQELTKLGEQAQQNNTELGVTGILLFFNDLFFQIIEGETENIDHIYHKIQADTRHKDLLCLKAEENVTQRHFPEWSMKLINLDQRVDELSRPIKLLLQALIESHDVIETYTQSSVLNIIADGVNPLQVPPKKVERIILFGDIFSYTTINEELSFEDVYMLINTYFEICTRIITQKGGEVNKFIGDGFLAYFDNDSADQAIEACIEILEEVNQVRKAASKDSPLSILYSGFGMAQGPVIEGNMGSDIKMDYTIIGDAVNRASRLESHTRVVEKSLVLSKLVKENCKKDWDFIRLGQYFLKGNREHTVVYTINNPLIMDYEERDVLIERIQNLAKRRYKN